MTSKIQESTGNELIQHAHGAWNQIAQDLPEQQKLELGHVMQELSNRISYVCKGQLPETATRYSALDGAALSYHAQHTIPLVAQQLPVSKRNELTEIVSEMANRVENASKGVFAFGSSNRQESGDLSDVLQREQQSGGRSTTKGRTPQFVS